MLFQEKSPRALLCAAFRCAAIPGIAMLYAACQSSPPPAVVNVVTATTAPSATAEAPQATATSLPSPTVPPATLPPPTTSITATAASAAPVSPSSRACFPPDTLNLFAFTPDGESILTRSVQGVHVISLDTLEEELFLKAPQPVRTAALSPDGKTLAWSLEDNTLQLVNMADQSVIADLTGHSDIVFKLRFSPTGDRLYSASHDTWVRIWDMEGNEVDAFQPTGADELTGEVLGIGVSPDGSRLATIPFDGPVKIWDLGTYQEIVSPGGTGGYDTSDAVFSPDGEYLAADLATGLFVWRLSDGASLLEPPVNSMAAAFSPDGRYLAYADISANGEILLASQDGSQVFHIMRGHPGAAWELIFSPDSTLLASTDGAELRVWSVEDGTLAVLLQSNCPQ